MDIKVDQRTGYTQFQVQGGAQYDIRQITKQEGVDLGCPGSNTMLRGRHGHIIGSSKSVTGKLVRVPGWSERKGVLTVFVPWNGQGETLKGWVGEP